MFRDFAETWLTSFADIDSFGVGGAVALAAVVFLFSFGLIYVLLRPQAVSRVTGVTFEKLADTGIVFWFAAERCETLTPSAEEFLNETDQSDAWGFLKQRFSKDTMLPDILCKLQSQGIAFERVLEDADGTYYEMKGKPVQGLSQICLEDVTISHSKRLALEAELVATKKELSNLSNTLKIVPALTWMTDSKGDVIWSNDAYKSASEDHTKPLFGEIPKDVDGFIEPKRVMLEASDGRTLWYTVEHQALEDGSEVHVALDATKIAEAEATLQRFIGTMTETFAQIPTGLAVFDADRMLSIFNPALTEMLCLEPAWLAGRPDLTAFMERLRDHRKMPEARDLLAWREKINSIETASAQGSFREDWELPGALTLRVTGRPYHNGAVALLFEDISIAKTLEQKYRAEIGLNRSILDNVSEAVVVFDTAGAMVFCNQSFETVWNFSPDEMTETPTIHDLKKEWESRSGALSLFSRAQNFVTGTGERTHWRGQFDTNDGTTLSGQFAPLPDGSTLMTFVDITHETTAPLAYNQMALDLTNQRDLVGLSLQHLKSYLSQERNEGREMRATLGDKLSMLEGLLWGASASSDKKVHSGLADGDLTSAIVAGRKQGLDVSLANTETVTQVFQAAGVSPQFLHSVLVLLGALVSNGGKAVIDGELDDELGKISILYTGEVAPDREERRFTLVSSLMRELAQKYNVSLSFEPGTQATSIRAIFAFPVLVDASTQLQSRA